MFNIYFLAHRSSKNVRLYNCITALKRQLHYYQNVKIRTSKAGSAVAGSLLPRRAIEEAENGISSQKRIISKRLISSNSSNNSSSNNNSTYKNSFAAAAALALNNTRNFSNDQSTGSEPLPPPEKIPPLMSFPQIMWPKITFAIKNFFLTYFVIKPHMDREFDIREFDKGARQALSFVSNCISKGDFDELAGLVSSEALSQIKENIEKLTTAQREMLAVNIEDIYFSFPYQIGIIIPDDQPSEHWVEAKKNQDPLAPEKRPSQIRHVEITVAFHVLKGLAEQVKTSGENRHFMEFLRQEDTKYKVMICNYRFWRDFTEGVKDSSWIVNVVSHFLPAAEVKQN